MALHRHAPGAEAAPPADALLSLPGLHGSMPHRRLPDGPMPASTAAQLVRAELARDGSAGLNLATFVTTWMEPEAEALMAATADKNIIDKDEYPQTAELERRCVNMIGSLWHASSGDGATGCSTTGSSEAAMLGGLALKWRWRERQRAAGKPFDKPNRSEEHTSEL